MVLKEKVALAVIYKVDGRIWLETTREANLFELHGFLSSYNDLLKESLLDDFERVDDE